MKTLKEILDNPRATFLDNEGYVCNSYIKTGLQFDLEKLIEEVFKAGIKTVTTGVKTHRLWNENKFKFLGE